MVVADRNMRMKSAYATIKGFEVMRALKKGQASPWRYQEGIMGEVRLIDNLALHGEEGEGEG